jgi:HSP20 family molecular chaperone IbpA
MLAEYRYNMSNRKNQIDSDRLFYSPDSFSSVFDHIFGELNLTSQTKPRSWFADSSSKNKDDPTILSVELPGVCLNDIALDVTLANQSYPQTKSGTFLIALTYTQYGKKYAQSWSIPYGHDHQGISATLKNGVLNIAIPRYKAQPAYKVKITEG